ncbi:hypothetical protein SpCBS45565_g04903 [Spizellomyces sp. 'palustris']|nr:hypothetical protein SpCBS45565_g04903 [Spizellomyces sp. 'palustris']
MNIVDSLRSSAASLYSEGKFKDAYNTYIRAANAALVTLANGVTWSGEDVTAKPDTTSELFRLTQQCLTRAEEIVKSRHLFTASSFAALPLSSVSATQSAHVPLSIPFPERVPMIPISPLTNQHALHAYQLSVAERRYAAATSAKDQPALSTMRRLVEDVRIQRAKVQELQKLADSVATPPLISWKAEAVALQIAIIDVSLFSKVRVRDDLWHRGSEIGLNGRACVHFNKYLERIAIDAILSSKPIGSTHDGPSARADTIAFLVSVAHTLFYHYRDINGMSAILQALESPEIRRLRRTWDTIHAKTKEAIRTLQSAIGAGTGNDHLDLVAQVLEHHYCGGGVLVAIPYLEPFIHDMEDLRNAYSAGVSGSTGGAMMSDIGARALEEIFSTIELCQGVGRPDPGLGKVGRVAAGAASRSRDSKTGNGLPEDLSSLGMGNQGLAHWLLTRVYWSRVELWGKSGDSERFRRDEQIPDAYKEVISPEDTMRNDAQVNSAATGTPYREPLSKSTVSVSEGNQRTETAASVPGGTPNQEIGEAKRNCDYMDQFLGDVDTPPADDQQNEQSNLLALLDELPSVPHLPDFQRALEESGEDNAHTQEEGDGQFERDAGSTNVGAPDNCFDETATGGAVQATVSDRPLSPPDSSNQVGDAGTESEDSHVPAKQGEGFDYMDRYLGPLDEPYPGSNMELPEVESQTAVEDQNPTTETLAPISSPQPDDARLVTPSCAPEASPVIETGSSQSIAAVGMEQDPDYDGYGLSDLEVDAGDYLDEVIAHTPPLYEERKVHSEPSEHEEVESANLAANDDALKQRFDSLR